MLDKCNFFGKSSDLATCNWSHFELDSENKIFIAYGGLQTVQHSTFEIILLFSTEEENNLESTVL